MHYWSGRVTRESNALDLEGGVFTWSDPKRIAVSLKRSAQQSHRRKADPYRSALSMLVFYINRAGKNLPAGRRRTLDKAKTELRRQFGRDWAFRHSCHSGLPRNGKCELRAQSCYKTPPRHGLATLPQRTNVRLQPAIVKKIGRKVRHR